MIDPFVAANAAIGQLQLQGTESKPFSAAAFSLLSPQTGAVGAYLDANGRLITPNSAVLSSERKYCTTQTDATDTTLANITGMSGFVLAAGGTYQFEINLAGTCGGTGGWKVAFNYTTATLTSIELTALAFTASAVAVTHSTTTTTQTSWIAANTAYIYGRLTGRLVVNAAGTLAVQFAENSANSTSSIYVGSSAVFVRTS